MILASLGLAKGAFKGLLRDPRGRLGAPRGLPRRRSEAPFGPWMASGGLLGPPWAPKGRRQRQRRPLGVDFGSFLGSFWHTLRCFLFLFPPFAFSVSSSFGSSRSDCSRLVLSRLRSFLLVSSRLVSLLSFFANLAPSFRFPRASSELRDSRAFRS